MRYSPRLLHPTAPRAWSSAGSRPALPAPAWLFEAWQGRRDPAPSRCRGGTGSSTEGAFPAPFGPPLTFRAANPGLRLDLGWRFGTRADGAAWPRSSGYFWVLSERLERGQRVGAERGLPVGGVSGTMPASPRGGVCQRLASEPLHSVRAAEPSPCAHVTLG